METTLITKDQAFYRMRESWDALLASSHADNPFLTWEWAYTWWQAMQDPDHELHILYLSEKGKWIGIAPFVIHHQRLAGLIPRRRIEFIGAELMSGEHLDLIVLPGYEDEMGRQIVSHLYRMRKSWDDIELYPFPEFSSTMNSFEKQCLAAEWVPMRCNRHTCPVLPLPADLENYKQNLTPHLAKKIDYERRRLLRRHSTKFERWSQLEQIETEIDRFFDLHQKKWLQEGKNGAFADPRKRLFYEILSRRMLEKNWLAMHSLRIDGEPIAYNYGLEYHNRFYGLQMAYDPEWKKLSVGWVLLYKTIENCIENGLQEIDTLIGTEPWKYELGSQNRHAMRLLVLQSKPLGRSYAQLVRAKRKMLGRHHSLQPAETEETLHP
ncbi:GNAT family N-acetyltransferase [candidate division KSB1 bacterium]|nr:GNAT family N-acetyltransferase [candidate division KSB1 bacterium]